MMEDRYGLKEIRRHRLEVDATKHLLAAYDRGELRARIGNIVHSPDGKTGLPCTACGVRWVPGASNVFPQGVPTTDAVDCMSCLVKAGLE